MLCVNEIRSFSSYSKGLYVVKGISETEQKVELRICFPSDFQIKLEKRFKKFSASAISVEGVYAQVTFMELNSIKSSQIEVVVAISKEIFSMSSLTEIQINDQVNIGMLSANLEKWLLDSTPLGTVKLVKIGALEGHRYTKEITFECSLDLFEKIKNPQYVGLNGSGLLLRQPCSSDGHHFFSIHAGRNTQEKTIFGHENLSLGTIFTLTCPHVI